MAASLYWFSKIYSDSLFKRRHPGQWKAGCPVPSHQADFFISGVHQSCFKVWQKNVPGRDRAVCLERIHRTTITTVLCEKIDGLLQEEPGTGCCGHPPPRKGNGRHFREPLSNRREIGRQGITLDLKKLRKQMLPGKCFRAA